MRYLKFGLTEHNHTKATPGFTLFSPLFQRKTYIINMSGEVVHEWELPGPPGDYAYILPNGNLFAATWLGGGPNGFFAKGGRLQEIDWHGKVVWEYHDEFQHHDFRRLKNGNTVYLGWKLLPNEAAACIKGGQPGSEHKDGIWGDYVREIDSTGETVWEWHCHEHMKLDNYPLQPETNRQEFAHANTIAPLTDGNFLICFRLIDLIAVINRQSGKITWERFECDWGGPHDLQELDNGNMMVFANRGLHAGPRGSSVIEFDRHTGKTLWEYKGNPTHTFDSPFISGCQRLESGNTLICEGQWGRLFEVTLEGDVVWEYVSPYSVNVSRAADEAAVEGDVNFIFRAYRYQADGPEIRSRLGKP